MWSEQYRFYAALPSLERLLDFEKLQAFCKDSGIEINDLLSQGYGFLIASQITRLIEYAIKNPFCIGLDRDILLDRAAFVGLPFYRMPYTSRLGKFVRNLCELCRSLTGAGSWIELRKVGDQIAVILVEPMRKAFEYATDIDVDKKGEFSKVKLEILKEASMSLFQILDHNIDDIKTAYYQTYKKIVFDPTYKRGFVKSIQKLPMTLGKQNFFEGYKLGVEYLWFSFIGTKYSQHKSLRKIAGAKDWGSFGNKYLEIREDFNKSFRYAEDFNKIFRLPSELNKTFLRGIFKRLNNSITFKQDEKTNSELLDEALLYYPINMLDVNNRQFAFAMLLIGYSTLAGGPIRIMKFIHPQQDGNDYGFALLMESYGLLTDSSSWVLFHDFATDYSGNGGSAYDFVNQHIKSLDKRILMTEIRIDARELRAYAEESGVNALEKQLERLEKNGQKYQSQLFELTTVYLLSRMGYSVRWAYSRTDVLGGREIDALAVKKEGQKVHVLVVETMEILHEDAGLNQEMQEKIRLVRKGWKDIATDFGLANVGRKPSSIEGWVMTRKKGRKIKLGKNIRVRDIDYLRTFCESHKIPYRSSLILSKSSPQTG